MLESLNPTFLYTWKGTRFKEQEKYHSHNDILEWCFVLSGSGKYKINDEIYDVSEGDLMIFNPGTKHQALIVKDVEVPATEFFVGFTNVSLKGCESNYIPLPEAGNILHTSGELKQKLIKICSQIEAENAISRHGRYFMMKSYLMQMLVLVLRELAEPVEYEEGYSFESINKRYIVKRIVDYFEDHYSERISLDSIAENMYLSPFYISKIFKSETGEAPIRHLINIRLDKAKEILESKKELSIQEVAALVGYDDAYHFSKLFKKRFGVSPSQMKKQ